MRKNTTRTLIARTKQLIGAQRGEFPFAGFRVVWVIEFTAL